MIINNKEDFEIILNLDKRIFFDELTIHFDEINREILDLINNSLKRVFVDKLNILGYIEEKDLDYFANTLIDIHFNEAIDKISLSFMSSPFEPIPSKRLIEVLNLISRTVDLEVDTNKWDEFKEQVFKTKYNIKKIIHISEGESLNKPIFRSICWDFDKNKLVFTRNVYTTPLAASYVSSLFKIERGKFLRKEDCNILWFVEETEDYIVVCDSNSIYSLGTDGKIPEEVCYE